MHLFCYISSSVVATFYHISIVTHTNCQFHYAAVAAVAASVVVAFVVCD